MISSNIDSLVLVKNGLSNTAHTLIASNKLYKTVSNLSNKFSSLAKDQGVVSSIYLLLALSTSNISLIASLICYLSILAETLSYKALILLINSTSNSSDTFLLVTFPSKYLLPIEIVR